MNSAHRLRFGKSAELLGVGEIGVVVPSFRLQVAGSTNRFFPHGALPAPYGLNLVLNL